ARAPFGGLVFPLRGDVFPGLRGFVRRVDDANAKHHAIDDAGASVSTSLDEHRLHSGERKWIADAALATPLETPAAEARADHRMTGVRLARATIEDVHAAERGVESVEAVLRPHFEGAPRSAPGAVRYVVANDTHFDGRDVSEALHLEGRRIVD